ncbi:MAG: methyltransferase [Desulfuromonas sp.]|nr:MAG: methyltransferase [Desulfuromonas sp.]
MVGGMLCRQVRVAWRTLFPRRLSCSRQTIDALRGECGLEIGGPSQAFMPQGVLPVYPVAARVDSCNFSERTVWDKAVGTGGLSSFSKLQVPGRRYIAEATNLSPFAAESYDFILASHVFEHSANPLRALAEAVRVLRPGGLLVVVLPHKDGTFDRGRPVTDLAHLVEDLHAERGEDDMTHLEEILLCHDLSMDPEAGDFMAFEARSKRNLENRCLHHHVFDTRLAVEMIHHAGLQIIAVEPTLPFDIHLVARKLPQGAMPSNKKFFGQETSTAWKSPFPSDRI